MSTRTIAYRSLRLDFVRLLVAVVAALAVSPQALPAFSPAATRYVAATGTDGTNDCLTQSSPCATIGYAAGRAAAGDTIAIGAGTYSERLNLSKSLTFTGAGSAKTFMDGGAGGTVVAVQRAATVSISDLTIRNGKSDQGAGINNSGTLSLTNAIVTGNAGSDGGGIYNAGTLSLSNTEVSLNTGFDGAGAMNFGGTFTATNSVFTFNVAMYVGGGLYNGGGGSATIAQSLFVNNTARNQPVAPATEGVEGGGGIFNTVSMTGSSTLTVSNSTFVSNQSAKTGSAIASAQGATITNSTVAYNVVTESTQRGAVEGGALANTLLVGNSGGNCEGVTSLGHNLSTDGTCGFTLATDQQNVSTPLVGALSNNGGATRTLALMTGSPAIDAGDDTICRGAQVNGIDQRGKPRANGAHCDIGAFEVEYVPTKLMVTLPTTRSGVSASTTATVTAVDDSNTPRLVTADTIFTMTSSVPTGYAPYPWTGTISRGTTSTTLAIQYDSMQSGVTVTATRTGGDNLASGTSAPFDVVEVFSPNTTQDTIDGTFGGALECLNAVSYQVAGGPYQPCSLRVTVATGTKQSTQAQALGMAQNVSVHIPAGTYTLTRGAIDVDANLDIVGDGAATTIIDAGGAGPAFNLPPGVTLRLSGVTIRNGGGSSGGLVSSGNLVVADSVFSGNKTINNGGAIHQTGGSLTVSSSTFTGNSARDGAAIHVTGTATIANSTFAGNSAANGGGAIAGGPGTWVTIANTTVSGNSEVAGALYGATFKVTNTILGGNAGGNCYQAPIRSGGANVSSDGSCGLGSPDDRQNIDPGLAPLGNYGGPVPTMALIGGSPALNAGNEIACAALPVGGVDQRGVTRPQGIRCDVGAFEAAAQGRKLSISLPTPAQPKPGQPFSVTVTAVDSASSPQTVAASTSITIAKGSGAAPSGALTGTLTHSIPAGQSSVTFTGLIYNASDSAVVLMATSPVGAGVGYGESAAFPIQNVFAVTTNVDSTVTCSASCSLRAAVAAANGSPGSLVTVPAGTYVLTQGEIAVNANMTISGAGFGQTFLDGNHKSRIFTVAARTTVSISGVTLRNGSALLGGAVQNFGRLTITDSTFANNVGSNAGGAILTDAGPTATGELILTRVTFSGNATTNNGGAILQNSGRLTISGSTFTGNSTSNLRGGALHTSGSGDVSISNSTFTANSANNGVGGAIFHNYGATLSLRNVTIANNGASLAGGVGAAGPVTMVNTIVAGNASGNCYVFAPLGSIKSLGHNLADDGTCALTATANGDLPNTSPVLGALASNGGTTQTMALTAGSPAIDAGDDLACAVAPVNGLDQRGTVRPQGAHCDIGAFEATPPLPAPAPMGRRRR